MLEKDLVTARQAAEILGRSPSTICRALASGKLEYADPEKKLLNRTGLEIRFANRTRPKADAPRVAKAVEGVALLPEPPSPPAIATTYWERAAQKLAFVLQGQEAYWAAEPDANRLRVFCRCIDEIRQQCADEGLEA